MDDRIRCGAEIILLSMFTCICKSLAFNTIQSRYDSIFCLQNITVLVVNNDISNT